MSVTMPEAFFGQLTHSIPAGASWRANVGKLFFHFRLALDEIMAKSSCPDLPSFTSTQVGESFFQCRFLRRRAAGKMRFEIVA